jgi:GTP-binding protein HflX
MARMGENEKCLFISAINKDNIEELRDTLYNEVKKIHAIRNPLKNFLY